MVGNNFCIISLKTNKYSNIKVLINCYILFIRFWQKPFHVLLKLFRYHQFLFNFYILDNLSLITANYTVQQYNTSVLICFNLFAAYY